MWCDGWGGTTCGVTWGGVDRMDQLRSYYSVGRAGRRWWKYIFWGLLNIGIINAYILWKKMNHPLPAKSRVSSMKTWKMRLIHNLVDDYVSRREQCYEPAVDNLSVELCRQHCSGTPTSPVLRPKENLQAMCPPEDEGSGGAIHCELFWLLCMQSLSVQNWLFCGIPP